MVIIPHAVIGSFLAALANKFFPGKYSRTLIYIISAMSAFAPHFLLDEIPHWEYSLFKPSLLVGILKALADSILAAIIIQLILKREKDKNLIFWGAFFGILPDIFVFGAFYFHLDWLAWFVNFHDRSHTSIAPARFMGIVTQVLLVLFIYFWAAILSQKARETTNNAKS